MSARPKRTPQPIERPKMRHAIYEAGRALETIFEVSSYKALEELDGGQLALVEDLLIEELTMIRNEKTRRRVALSMPKTQGEAPC